MTATLTNKQDYFKGNYNLYALKQVIAKAGGNNNHVNLYNYLISSSIEVYNNTTDKSYSLFDCRASSSLLFLFPPQLQILLAVLFYTEEVKTRDTFKNNLEDKEELIVNISSPIELLELSSSNSQIIISNTIKELLNRIYVEERIDRLSSDLLSFLLGRTNPSGNELFSLSDLTIRDKLDRIFNNVNISTNNYAEILKNVATNNNKLEAGVIIAERLGYNSNCIRLLARVLEKWLLQISDI